MYMDKEVKRGYNEYLRLDEGEGKDGMMDVALLVMEAGDTYTIEEADKEVACLLFDGDVNMSWDDQSVDMVRPNPFDYNPWCLLVHKQTKIVITAKGPSNIYVQKTLNDKTEPEFPNKLFRPEDTDTWARGTGGVLQNCIKRDVRTCFDLDIAPYSNMVLGEVINLPGKWSSYPPHHHPQPEVYYYQFDHEEGFGAGFEGDTPYKTQNGSCLCIRGGNAHQQVTAPAFEMYYVWMIRHLDGDPWDKTRIYVPEYEWLANAD